MICLERSCESSARAVSNDFLRNEITILTYRSLLSTPLIDGTSPMGRQMCHQYNGHIPSSRAEGNSVYRATWWKRTICIHEDGNTLLVKSSWNKAAPHSQVTLCCVTNLGYSTGKGEPQQDVQHEKVYRRASLQEKASEVLPNNLEYFSTKSKLFRAEIFSASSFQHSSNFSLF